MATDSAAFRERYGPWALVTGAASGLGKEFTRQLAERKLNIVAVDVQERALYDQVASLREHYGVEARALVVDLAGPEVLATIAQETSDLEVGLVANVAGLAHVGPFLDTPLAVLQRQLAVNCQTPLVLAYHFGQLMRTRRRGGLIFISSASAYQGTALVAHYAATKAYNLILAEGIWDELRACGVDVLGFSPGATNTPGFHSANPQYKAVSNMPYMEPEPTVAEALAALGKYPSKIAGRANRLAALLTSRALPRKRAIRLFGENMRKLYPHIPLK